MYNIFCVKRTILKQRRISPARSRAVPLFQNSYRSGALAKLGSRLNGIQEARGSNPLCSINIRGGIILRGTTRSVVDSLGCLSGERMKRNAKHSFFKGRVPGCVQKNAKHFYYRQKPWKWRVSKVFSYPFCRWSVLKTDFPDKKEHQVFFFWTFL